MHAISECSHCMQSVRVAVILCICNFIGRNFIAIYNFELNSIIYCAILLCNFVLQFYSAIFICNFIVDATLSCNFIVDAILSCNF